MKQKGVRPHFANGKMGPDPFLEGGITMPRALREIVEGYPYHILNRGNGKQEIFHKAEDYNAFINLLKEAKERHTIYTYAYCVMPNHFHFGTGVIISENLSRYMHWLTTTHARRYHSHYETSGHIWQGRYKGFLVQNDEHFLTILRYIEGNPVRAGLVKSARDWPWSSHLERIGKKDCGMLDKLPIDLPKDWTRYVDEPLTQKELESIRKSVIRQCPYGEPEWQLKMCKMLGLESSLNPRGRPKKKNE